MKFVPKYVYYVNYKKRPSKRKPKRMWMSAHKRFDTEGEMLQWMKANGLKIDRWTSVEKCEIDNTLFADVFHL